MQKPSQKVKKRIYLKKNFGGKQFEKNNFWKLISLFLASKNAKSDETRKYVVHLLKCCHIRKILKGRAKQSN